jgi:hypothetical protein
MIPISIEDLEVGPSYYYYTFTYYDEKEGIKTDILKHIVKKNDYPLSFNDIYNVDFIGHNYDNISYNTNLITNIQNYIKEGLTTERSKKINRVECYYDIVLPNGIIVIKEVKSFLTVFEITNYINTIKSRI